MSETNNGKSTLSKLLPVGLAVAGVAIAAAITIYLLNREEETEDSEHDVENYDLKNEPLLFV